MQDDKLDAIVAEICAALPYVGDYMYSREELMAPIIRAAILTDREQRAERVVALTAAGDALANAIDAEIMPRYMELFEASGLGNWSQCVGLEIATGVLRGWIAALAADR